MNKRFKIDIRFASVKGMKQTNLLFKSFLTFLITTFSLSIDFRTAFSLKHYTNVLEINNFIDDEIFQHFKEDFQISLNII